MARPQHPHDLPLPAWGPYSKRYAGCSHLGDLERGVRLDLSVFPGIYRGRLDIPNVAWDSGYAPWLAAGDASYHSFKHQLEWRDQVTAETAWLPLADGGEGILAEVALENRTALPQTLVLHLVAGCQYPTPKPSGHSAPPVARPADVLPEEGALVRDARDDDGHQPGRPHPRDGLCTDGWAWHEALDDGCVDGGFRFLDPGDRLRFRLGAGPAGSRLWLRWRAAGETRLAVDTIEHPLTGDGTWTWLELPAPQAVLDLRQAGGVRLDLDCLVLARARPTVQDRIWRPDPAISPGPSPCTALLRWPDLPGSYALWWDLPAKLRQWHCESLDEPMRRAVHVHGPEHLHGPGAGHWTDIQSGPIDLAPGATRRFHFACLHGDPVRLAQRLAGLDPVTCTAAAAVGRARAFTGAGNPSGAEHRLGQQLMAASLGSNLVFPIYTRRGYVRHHSPGKTWDSLYTWDAGFIGLGLLELDPDRALACLEQYLTPEGDPDCAFLHHGSPVPVQLHLAREWFNRSGDRAVLARLYPRLRQYHRFLAGRHGSSDTARLASGLLSTWSYFYNSGGWDDYPPQVHLHRQGLAGSVAAIAPSAQAIATARLLRRLARLLGLDDGAEYDADIARLGQAIQQHAWDPDEGWYGYVEHDEQLRPTGLLRHASGANFNRGLDGCYPLVAGICTPEQEARLLGHLASPERLWSVAGLSTVDQSAPYYRADGYWNGTVWMAHQWFFWKALLDLGQSDLAFRIAERGLAVWSRECGASERCFEHFPIVTGRGAGWHHFGALSTPVLSWYAALHRPGRLSGGHGLWILEQASNDRRLQVRLQLDGAAGRRSTLLATLKEGPARAIWNGEPLPLRARLPGCWECELPADGAGELVVEHRE